MLKKLFKIKRYFIVSYNFKTGSGFVEVWTTKGLFINKNIFTEDIIKKLKKLDVDHGNIVITNILEISKRDYEDFIRNDKPESSRKVSDM